MAASGHTGRYAGAAAAPLLIRRPGHAALGVLVLAIASVWLTAAIRGILAGDSAIVPGLGRSGAYWVAAAGAALAVLGAHWIVQRQALTIDRGALVVTERSLLGGRSWREPLTNYREIRCRVEQWPHRYGRRSWYVAWLWHPEPAKRIELVRARDPAAIGERARECARRLGLPLVWEQCPSNVMDRDGVRAADQGAQGGFRDEVAAAAGTGRSLSAS